MEIGVLSEKRLDFPACFFLTPQQIWWYQNHNFKGA